LLYPEHWHIRSQVVATEFVNSDQCESVEVVDFQPPPGSGAGFILHSFVQICAKPLSDSLTLDGFMRQTYGDSTSQFQVTELAGRQASLPLCRCGAQQDMVFADQQVPYPDSHGGRSQP
jgi:hypothetical protein